MIEIVQGKGQPIGSSAHMRITGFRQRLTKRKRLTQTDTLPGEAFDSPPFFTNKTLSQLLSRKGAKLN